MPWTVEYVPERDMALVVATGEIFDRDARGQVAETIRLLQEHRANLVLVDYADALTEVLLSSLYWLPEYAAELGGTAKPESIPRSASGCLPMNWRKAGGSPASARSKATW